MVTLLLHKFYSDRISPILMLPVVIFVLVLIVAGLGLFFLYRYVFAGEDDEGGSGGSSGHGTATPGGGDYLMDYLRYDFLMVQIAIKIRQIEDLKKEKAEIRMELLEEEREHEAEQLSQRLKQLLGQLEKARRRLERLRREAEQNCYSRAPRPNDDKLLADFIISRSELIQRSLEFSNFDAEDDKLEDNKSGHENRSAILHKMSETLTIEKSQADDTKGAGPESDAECSICLGDYQEGDTIAQSRQGDCSHRFHEECITLWLRRHNHCPLCRSRIVQKKHFDQEAAECV